MAGAGLFGGAGLRLGSVILQFLLCMVARAPAFQLCFRGSFFGLAILFCLFADFHWRLASHPLSLFWVPLSAGACLACGGGSGRRSRRDPQPLARRRAAVRTQVVSFNFSFGLLVQVQLQLHGTPLQLHQAAAGWSSSSEEGLCGKHKPPVFTFTFLRR